jgi:hypothetical protein
MRGFVDVVIVLNLVPVEVETRGSRSAHGRPSRFSSPPLGKVGTHPPRCWAQTTHPPSVDAGSDHNYDTEILVTIPRLLVCVQAV